MEFIDLKQQYQMIKSSVHMKVDQVLESGQYILGEEVKELEAKLSAFRGASHVVGVADGTRALLISLMALDLKAGDEVIVPDFTFIATASMALLLGLKPVVVDIDPLNYCIDPNKIESAITPRTRAIIAVSLFGQCADFDAINTIAEKHHLVVIEDGAQSFGACYQGKHSCNLTKIATTSFFPSKPLGGYGDGGACFTNDEGIATKFRQIRVHGQDRRYHHAILGVDGRLDTLQAAILLAKLEIFDKEVILRQRIGARYSEKLSSYCVTPKIMPGNTHVYAQYSILVENREQFIANLKTKGIPTAVHYPIPLHQQPVMQSSYSGENVENSLKVAKRVVSLPMHPYLDEKTQDQIIEAVKESI